MATPPRFPTLRETELGIPDGPIDGAALRDVFKRFFSQTNSGLDSTNRSLSRGLTPPDNFRCDIITAKATHGVPFTVRLKTIKQANSCLVVGFDTALPAGAGVQMLQPSQSGGFPTAQVTVWFNDTTKTGNVRLWLFEDGLQMTSVPTFVAGAKQNVVGQQVSASSGAFSTASAAYVDVTNLAVTLTTIGRPVMIVMQPDGALPANITSTVASAVRQLRLLRDAAIVGEWKDAPPAAPTMYQPSVLDVAAAAGTHTWKVQAQIGGGATIQINNYVLAAYEL